FLFQRSATILHLHSFPTRRSSDLKDNGPYVAVAFTKHPELVADLDDYIFPNPEIARPYAFVTIGKEECRDVPALAARIDEELKKDRKSTRLNSSHVKISYAVFCLK